MVQDYGSSKNPPDACQSWSSWGIYEALYQRLLLWTECSLSKYMRAMGNSSVYITVVYISESLYIKAPPGAWVCFLSFTNTTNAKTALNPAFTRMLLDHRREIFGCGVSFQDQLLDLSRKHREAPGSCMDRRYSLFEVASRLCARSLPSLAMET